MKILGIRINKKSLVRWKIYIDRARMYIGYISFIMIAFVFLNDFKDENIRSLLDENKLITYPVVMVLFIVFSLILGRLDTKLGVRREEMRNTSTENPVLMDLLNTAKGIEQTLKKNH